MLWMLIIAYLSFTDLKELPVPKFFSADKIGHIGMYFILQVFLAFPVNNSRKAILLSSVLGFFYAGFTELIQDQYVLNRTGDWADFIANCIGITLALYSIFKFKKI